MVNCDKILSHDHAPDFSLAAVITTVLPLDERAGRNSTRHLHPYVNQMVQLVVDPRDLARYGRSEYDCAALWRGTYCGCKPGSADLGDRFTHLSFVYRVRS